MNNEDWHRLLDAQREAYDKMPKIGEPWVDGEPPKQGLLCRWGFHPSTFMQSFGLGVSFDVCNVCYRRVR